MIYNTLAGIWHCKCFTARKDCPVYFSIRWWMQEMMSMRSKSKVGGISLLFQASGKVTGDRGPSREVCWRPMAGCMSGMLFIVVPGSSLVGQERPRPEPEPEPHVPRLPCHATLGTLVCAILCYAWLKVPIVRLAPSSRITVYWVDEIVWFSSTMYYVPSFQHALVLVLLLAWWGVQVVW